MIGISSQKLSLRTWSQYRGDPTEPAVLSPETRIFNTIEVRVTLCCTVIDGLHVAVGKRVTLRSGKRGQSH